MKRCLVLLVIFFVGLMAVNLYADSKPKAKKKYHTGYVAEYYYVKESRVTCKTTHPKTKSVHTVMAHIEKHARNFAMAKCVMKHPGDGVCYNPKYTTCTKEPETVNVRKTKWVWKRVPVS